MREHQRKVIEDWLDHNEPVTITAADFKGRFKVSWVTTDGRQHGLTGTTGDSVDDILCAITYSIWHPLEEQDRKNQPAYDRT